MYLPLRVPYFPYDLLSCAKRTVSLEISHGAQKNSVVCVESSNCFLTSLNQLSWTSQHLLPDARVMFVSATGNYLMASMNLMTGQVVAEAHRTLFCSMKSQMYYQSTPICREEGNDSLPNLLEAPLNALTHSPLVDCTSH